MQGQDPVSQPEPPGPDSAPRVPLALSVVVALVTVGFFVTAWGWDDWRGFFKHPARLGFTLVLLAQVVARAGQKRLPVMSKGIPGKRVREPGFFALMYMAALASMFAPYFDRHRIWPMPGGDWTRYFGFILFGIGAWITARAQVHLGRFFSGHLTVQPGHRLITDGPYKHVRHPRYAGMVGVFFGMGVLFASWASLIPGLLCAVLLVTRIPREERFLAAEFPNDWPAYTARTWRLFPGIY